VLAFLNGRWCKGLGELLTCRFTLEKSPAAVEGKGKKKFKGTVRHFELASFLSPLIHLPINSRPPHHEYSNGDKNDSSQGDRILASSTVPRSPPHHRFPWNFSLCIPDVSSYDSFQISTTCSYPLSTDCKRIRVPSTVPPVLRRQSQFRPLSLLLELIYRKADAGAILNSVTDSINYS